MKSFLCLAGVFLLGLSAYAADPAPMAKLDQFKLGAYITGPQISLENTKGKAVLIQPWGIASSGCLLALPEMEKISKRYKDKLVVFGAQLQDVPDEQVKEMVKRNRLTYTITKNMTTGVAFTSLPHVLLFDPAGTLAYSGSPADPDFEKALRKVMKDDAGAKPSGLDALKKPAN